MSEVYIQEDIIQSEEFSALEQTVRQAGCDCIHPFSKSSFVDGSLVLGQPALVISFFPKCCEGLKSRPESLDFAYILSICEDREQALRAIEYGADDVWVGGWDPEAFASRIHVLLQRKSPKNFEKEYTRFQWVAEQSGDGFLLLDEQDHILYANIAARQYLHIPLVGSITGHAPVLELFKKHYHLQPEESWNGWPAPTGQACYLVRPESDHAGTLWLEATVLYQPSGSGMLRLLHLQDVTGLVSNQRSIWTFHSTISHKLRTPLNAIVPAIELLQIDADNLSPDDIRELAQSMNEGARRLSDQLQHILTYLDRLSSPDSYYTEGVVVSSARVEEILASTAEEVSIAEPCVLNSLSQETGLRISEDALLSVVHELFTNSRKFHPDQAPGIQVILSEAGEGMAKLVFRDDGVRIPAEQLSEAWKPYRQVEKYHTGEVQGMGLGLSMVAAIIWGAGGSCTLTNRGEAPGVCVTLRLPLFNRP